MAKWGDEEWWALEQSKDLLNLVARQRTADAETATARATQRRAEAGEQQAKATERLADAAEERAQIQEEHARRMEGFEQKRLEMVEEERQREQRKREAKDEVFSLKLQAEDMVKALGKDPLSSYIRLQMMSRQLRLIPRQLLDDYGDKALHAEVSDRLNEGLGDVKAMAPSEIECLEQILRYGHMVGLSALALDAYWDRHEIAPLRNKCNDLNTKLTKLEGQIRAKRESAKRAGHWVVRFIVMLVIGAVALMMMIV